MKAIVSDLLLFCAVIVAGTVMVLALGSPTAATQLADNLAALQLPSR